MSVKQKIIEILENNKLNDLTRFIEKRQCLNKCNLWLIYLFHTIQSAGILTTTIATGYGMTQLIWVGVGLNVFASLINIFEQTNNSISLKILKDIIAIRDDKYVDENTIVDTEDIKESHNTNKRNSIVI